MGYRVSKKRSVNRAHHHTRRQFKREEKRSKLAARLKSLQLDLQFRSGTYYVDGQPVSEQS